MILEQLIFTILAFGIFVYMFFKMFKENDTNYIGILIIEAIRRKPLKEQTEINIQLLGFSILIVLSLYVTYNDIIRIF